VYSDGSVIEMATIGREGCVGVQVVLGAKISSHHHACNARTIGRKKLWREEEIATRDARKSIS